MKLSLLFLFCVRLWFPKLDHLPYLYTPRIVIPTEQKHSKTFNLLLQIFHSIRPFYFHPQICMFVHFTDVSGSFLEMWRSNTFISNLKCIRNCDDRELLNFALTAERAKINCFLSSVFWIHLRTLESLWLVKPLFSEAQWTLRTFTCIMPCNWSSKVRSFISSAAEFMECDTFLHDYMTN